MTTAGGVLATLAKSEIEGVGEKSFLSKRKGNIFSSLHCGPKLQLFVSFGVRTVPFAAHTEIEGDWERDR